MSTADQADDLTIASRYCGPSGSGNGGFTAGSLAARLPAITHRSVVEVTLRHPPPLDVPMKVEQVRAQDPANMSGQESTLLLIGGAKIAEARLVDTSLEPVEEVSPEDAAQAMARFPGRVSHPFPTCFACGPDRAEGDGLRIFPGPVDGGRVASVWVPHESLTEPTDPVDDSLPRVGLGAVWAALDCVGGWAGDIGERRMVLGRMTAHVDALALVGDRHVVVGAPLGREGRKTWTASTLYDGDRRIVGRARHTWIAIDPSAFG